MAIVRTAGGGISAGTVTGENLPDSVATLSKQIPGLTAVTAVRQLVGAGFALVTTTAEGRELIFTLVRSPTTAAPTRQAEAGEPLPSNQEPLPIATPSAPAVVAKAREKTRRRRAAPREAHDS